MNKRRIFCVSATLLALSIGAAGCDNQVSEQEFPSPVTHAEGVKFVIDTAKADRSESGLSYGELAEVRITPIFERLLSEVGTLNSNSEPGDLTPILERLNVVRDMMDIFIFAYPTPEWGDDDLWGRIRGHLEGGHNALVAFESLADPQAEGFDMDDREDADAYEELYDRSLTRLLGWVEVFEERAFFDDYADYLSSPEHRQIHERPLNQQNPFFWGGCDIKPSRDRSGIENIAYLATCITVIAEWEFQGLQDIDEPTRVSDYSSFHSFETHLAVIATLNGYFPAIIESGAGPLELEAGMRQLLARFESLNAKLAHYEKLLQGEQEDEDELGSLEDTIGAEWEALFNWLDDEDMHDVLEDIQDEFLS